MERGKNFFLSSISHSMTVRLWTDLIRGTVLDTSMVLGFSLTFR